MLEDIPGVGKTTLAKIMAYVLGLEFKRIQFVADLLPSDIIGVNYFNGKEFVLKKGPIFTEILLADEINRASAKTQSALLEAMEERQVSIDGESFKLSENFFVIATQNPLEVGTFPLPKSQLDRFMISLSLGYPDREFEREILLRDEFVELRSFPEKIDFYKKRQKEIFVDKKIIELILDIGEFSRKNYELGLSTRALIALKEISKSYALIENREYVIDNDIYEVLEFVIRHRIDGEIQKILQAFFS